MTAGRPMRVVAGAAAMTAVLALAAWLRCATFWAPHTDPVEFSYLTLAMKIGSKPGLIGYGFAGTEIRKTRTGSLDDPDESLTIATPFQTGPATVGPFDGWPTQDPDPFVYKPPYLPALLAYSHHLFLGPRFAYYPVNADDGPAERMPEPSWAVFRLQAWAVVIPFLFGLLTVFLTGSIGWSLFGPRRGIAAALLCAVYPAQIAVSMRVWPEAMLTACALTAFYAFLHFTSRSNPAGCLLAGAAWGLAGLTDSSALFFVPAFILWSFYVRKKFLNGYLAAFLLGALAIYKVWPDHVHQAYSDLWLRTMTSVPAADPSAAWHAGYVLPVGLARSIAWGIPIAAVIATAARFFGGSSARPGLQGRSETLVLWTFVIGFIVCRSIIGPNTIWDVRSVAPLVPFIALLAVQPKVRR